MLTVGTIISIKTELGIKRIKNVIEKDNGDFRIPQGDGTTILFNSDMRQYLGKEFPIVAVEHADTDHPLYRLEGIDQWAWTQSCFRKNTKKVVCSHCGKKSSDIKLIDGIYYCADCIEELFVKCDRCGRYEKKEDIQTVDGNKHWCHRCVENYAGTCDDCGKLVSHRTCTDDGNNVCQTCLEANYFQCSDCGNWYPEADRQDDDENVCENCQDRRENNVIQDYSYRPNPIFYNENGKINSGSSEISRNRFFGVELEIEFPRDNPGRLCKQITNIEGIKNHAYWKHDGSLGCGGAEFVTHPHNMSAHKLLWEPMTAKAIALHGKSHQTRTCGLHVHVNRESLGGNSEERSDTVANAMIIVNENWADIVKFSRRRESELNDWSANPIDRMDNDNYADNRDDTGKVKKSAVKSYCSNTGNRYQAINVQNRNTIEFRIFKGTLKASTVLASIQFVDIICELSKGADDEVIYKLRFKDFIAKATELGYTEFVEYCGEKELS